MKQIQTTVGSLRGKLEVAGVGWLDVPGRGSGPKTLKEEESRSVCGAEIKLTWLELQ